jgi:type I restriction enzyme S subunit
MAVGGVVNNLNSEMVRKIDVPIPAKHIQKDIADLLDKLKNIIAMHQKEIQILDILIKARFVEMFGDIEENCDVGYYIKALIAGKSFAGEDECKNKVLKTGAVSFDYFDATQVKNLPLGYVPQNEHLVNNGDIIISRMNTAELTGAAAYVWNVPENVYLPDRLWKAVLQDDCNPIFVWQMLIQPSTKEQIRRECSGTSGSMKNISKSSMLSIKVKNVSIALQNQFADFVKQVDKSKVAIQKALDEAQLLFDSLMQKYFG